MVGVGSKRPEESMVCLITRSERGYRHKGPSGRPGQELPEVSHGR